MDDSEILAAIKAQFEGQKLAMESTLKTFMSSLDSRLGEMNSRLPHVSGSGAAQSTASGFGPVTNRSSGRSLPSNNSVADVCSSTPQTPPDPSLSHLPIRRLSPAKIEDLNDRGLCYNCEQIWSDTHRCRSQCLILFGTEEGDEFDDRKTQVEVTAVEDLSKFDTLLDYESPPPPIPSQPTEPPPPDTPPLPATPPPKFHPPYSSLQIFSNPPGSSLSIVANPIDFIPNTTTFLTPPLPDSPKRPLRLQVLFIPPSAQVMLGGEPPPIFSLKGVAIKASLVRKVIEERKESLMTRARAKLLITSLEPCPVSEPVSARPSTSSIGLKRTAPDGHSKPSVLGSKDVQKSKSKVSCHNSKSKNRSINSLSCEASRKLGEDKRVELELEPEHQLFQIQNGKGETSPNSSISSQSSVMKTRFGEDSLQLYKACLLPMDQIALASMAHSTLEEIAAHDLMRVAAVTHQLALQCSNWQKEMGEKAAQVERAKEHVEIEVRAEYEPRLHALERQLTKLKAWSEEAELTLLKSKLEIERLEKAGKDSFDAGRAAGRQEMADSEEFRAAIRQTMVSGVKDYLRSPTFELALATKAAEHEVIGFMRCQSQVLKLGGFKEGFDVGLLDSTKDENLESPVAEVEEDEAED